MDMLCQQCVCVCVYIYSLKDMSGAMNDSNGWKERIKEMSKISSVWLDDDI